MERNGSSHNKKQTIILRALQYLNKEQREADLRKGDSRTTRCICECALYILRGNVLLKAEEKGRKKASTRPRGWQY